MSRFSRSSLRSLVSVLPSLLAACSTASEPAAPPGAPPSVETPAEGPAACGEGTYRNIERACVTFPAVAFQRSPVQIAPSRDHHTTMVIETSSGPWLYVAGGTDGWETLHDDVQRAPIGEDGSLGPFESAGKLPEGRAGHCMVRRGDRLYLFGGIVGGTRSGPSTTSVVLSLDGEGKITGASPGPELPLAVMHLACELVDDTVYALGGRGANSRSTKLSARTRIGPDGTPAAFEPTTPLVPDRSHHAAFVRGKRLYVLGGITGDPVSSSAKNRKDVVVADIGEDGTLGEWLSAGALPTSISVSSAQLYRDAVYVVGGLEQDGFTPKIRRATFLEDGTLDAFVTLDAELPDGRGHVHQTPMHGPFMFSVGGKNDFNESLGTVDVGRFDEAP